MIPALALDTFVKRCAAFMSTEHSEQCAASPHDAENHHQQKTRAQQPSPTEDSVPGRTVTYRKRSPPEAQTSDAFDRCRS